MSTLPDDEQTTTDQLSAINTQPINQGSANVPTESFQTYGTSANGSNVSTTTPTLQPSFDRMQTNNLAPVEIKQGRKNLKWVLIIFTVAIIGALGFIYWQNVINSKNKVIANSNITPSSISNNDTCVTSSASTTSSTDGWLTLTSSKHNFSFKYPSNLKVTSEIKKNTGKYFWCEIAINKNENINTWGQTKTGEAVSWASISVVTGINPSNYSYSPSNKFIDVTLNSPSGPISAKYVNVTSTKSDVYIYNLDKDDGSYSFNMFNQLNDSPIMSPDQFKLMASSISF